MNITEQFLNFTLLGAEWVLWLLIGLSILSIGVMVERFMFFSARTVDPQKLSEAVRRALDTGELVLVWDPAAESCNVLTPDEARAVEQAAQAAAEDGEGDTTGW